jgi:hypothetical protein
MFYRYVSVSFEYMCLSPLAEMVFINVLSSRSRGRDGCTNIGSCARQHSTSPQNEINMYIM